MRIPDRGVKESHTVSAWLDGDCDEPPLPPWNQQQNEQQQRLPVRSARLCRVEAQEPVDQT